MTLNVRSGRAELKCLKNIEIVSITIIAEMNNPEPERYHNSMNFGIYEICKKKQF